MDIFPRDLNGHALLLQPPPPAGRALCKAYVSFQIGPHGVGIGLPVTPVKSVYDPLKGLAVKEPLAAPVDVKSDRFRSRCIAPPLQI